MRWICGDRCSSTEDKVEMLAHCKQVLDEEYLFVGILERWDDALVAMESLLPNFFKGARKVSKMYKVQNSYNGTSTSNKHLMNDENYQFLLNNGLKYEMDLYEYAVRLFNKKLRKLRPY